MWEPGCALGEVPLALVPEALLGLILQAQKGASVRIRCGTRTAESPIQPIKTQEYFASLWLRVGVSLHEGDVLYVCAFHPDRDPSLHVDSRRCVWYCFAPHCPCHNGGGIRELEARVGVDQPAGIPLALISQRNGGADGSDGHGEATELGKEAANPNADTEGEDLEARARELFPLPPDIKPLVVANVYALAEDPTRAMRQQIVSNTWVNPANRALKKRLHWAHLVAKVRARPASQDDSPRLYDLRVPQEDWTDRKRESLSAQVRRRGGEYAAFDDRHAAGVVRLFTTVCLEGSRPTEDAEQALFEALRDVEPPEDHQGKQRLRLVWLSKGWALPAHKSKGVLKLIATRSKGDPVDDAAEAEEARQQGFETWSGLQKGLDEWGPPRYFAVPKERVAQVGKEGALDDILTLTHRLGYRSVYGAWERILGEAREAST